MPNNATNPFLIPIKLYNAYSPLFNLLTQKMALGFLKALSLFFFLLFTKSYGELITALPDQPSNVSFKQYSGYTVTDAQHGRALFYYFAEADSVDPLTRPLTLWLNGGPGCSSLGFGAFMEHGPFQPGENGILIKNKYSWNLASNVLYVESPIGVGFSYSNTSSDYFRWNDTETAADNLRFIISWLEEFPQYKDSELYLTGESYAGHYVPQLAALIVEYNKMPNIAPIKLKAIAIGNPLLDLDISITSGDYLWSHGALSDETLALEKTICNDSTFWKQRVHGNLSSACTEVYTRVSAEVGNIDSSDILLPLCLSSTNAVQFKSLGIHASLDAKLSQTKTSGDPCLTDRIFTYLNRPEVQKALHANTTILPYKWGFCRGGPLSYQMDNLDMNIIPVMSDIIIAGIPLMLFSGDQDTKIPLTQTRTIANMIARDLKLFPFTKYGPWYDQQQIGGWAQSFSGIKDGKNVTYLTYATLDVSLYSVKGFKGLLDLAAGDALNFGRVGKRLPRVMTVAGIIVALEMRTAIVSTLIFLLQYLMSI
ncbi:hypothetical protein IFM89_002765 [Coptis chinensis]|uniref:Carboxypeptidase n=1 Tax=Coptis chinensis TaxID=261450 RepID=A0A835LQV2_9MAGN|nr:hypothetical protein IFM89_002765 [Coptis chinensis]